MCSVTLIRNKHLKLNIIGERKCKIILPTGFHMLHWCLNKQLGAAEQTKLSYKNNFCFYFPYYQSVNQFCLGSDVNKRVTENKTHNLTHRYSYPRARVSFDIFDKVLWCR